MYRKFQINIWSRFFAQYTKLSLCRSYAAGWYLFPAESTRTRLKILYLLMKKYPTSQQAVFWLNPFGCALPARVAESFFLHFLLLFSSLLSSQSMRDLWDLSYPWASVWFCSLTCPWKSVLILAIVLRQRVLHSRLQHGCRDPLPGLENQPHLQVGNPLWGYPVHHRYQRIDRCLS